MNNNDIFSTGRVVSEALNSLYHSEESSKVVPDEGNVNLPDSMEFIEIPPQRQHFANNNIQFGAGSSGQPEERMHPQQSDASAQPYHNKGAREPCCCNAEPAGPRLPARAALRHPGVLATPCADALPGAGGDRDGAVGAVGRRTGRAPSRRPPRRAPPGGSRAPAHASPVLRLRRSRRRRLLAGPHHGDAHVTRARTQRRRRRRWPLARIPCGHCSLASLVTTMSR